MKLTKRETEIHNIIYEKTLQAINNNDYYNLGYDALNLSLDLFIDRANISRILNRLNDLELLTKVLGRPTIYFSIRAITESYPDVLCPNVMSSSEEFSQFLNNSIFKSSNINNPFSSIFGINENESLYDVVEQLKTAIEYPPHGISTTLFGEQGTGKRLVLQGVFNYALKKQHYESFHDLIEVDCSNVDESVNINDLIDRSKKQMIVLYDYALLSTRQLAALSKLINSALYSIPVFIVLTNSVDDNKSISTPINITIPPFNDRTVKEKMLIILSMIDEEVKRINRIVTVPKNIINCFVMSHYPDNLYSLKREIQYTMSSLLRCSTNNTVEINFSNLSDKLLNSVTIIDSRHIELYSIYDILDMDKFIFSPFENIDFISEIDKKIKYLDDGSITSLSAFNNLDVLQQIRLLVKNKIQISLSTLYSNSYAFANNDLVLCLNVVLNDSFLNRNKNLYYGFFDSILYLTNEFTSLPLFRQSCMKNLEHSDELNNIASILNSKFNIKLNQIQLTFLDCYLAQTKSIIMNSTLHLYIVSSSDLIAETFFSLANKFSVNNNVSKLNSIELQLSNGSILKNHQENSRGIVMLCSEPLSYDLKNELKHKFNPIIISDSINLYLIPKIMELLNDNNTLIDDFSFINQELYDSGYTSKSNTVEEYLKNTYLTQYLSFLNPVKLCDLALDSLINISNKMKIEMSDVLIFKFVTHVAFMVERLIKREILDISNKNFNEFYKQNRNIIKIVENNMVKLKNQYDITIPRNEIFCLTEVFLEINKQQAPLPILNDE